MNEEKRVLITTKEKKYILNVLKGYKRVLEEGYRQTRRKKNKGTLLGTLFQEITKVDKLITVLKSKVEV